MLTCSTVRTKYSCLITRFQTLWPRRVAMLWHLCQSTLSKPDQIQWVWIHFCCSSNSLLLGTDVFKYELYVFILQHYLRLLAPCCNPTNHLKKMPFKYSNPPVCQLHLCWRCSDPKKNMENWADLWVTVWKVYWVCKKIRTNQSSFCLMATQVVLLQKTILIWDGRNHLAVTLLIRKRQPRYTA